MTIMYPAKVNSPATTLDGGIDDSQTTIPLVDASVLPDPPNLAVIGTGEDAETVLYPVKDGNNLTGCTREFQGVAKAWDSGTSVARMFTAYDYDTVRTNLGGQVARTVAYTVAANDATALEKAQADYVCDGTDDHVQIQAAIDALPASGGEVHLSSGTFNVESSIVLDSYQTLRGQGRSTILTTTTADLDIITATGGDGTEKVGILIADFCIDGDAGAATNDCGIKLTYVDKSIFRDCWLQDNGEPGLYMINSDDNVIENLIVSGNNGDDIYLEECDRCRVAGCNITNTSTDFGMQIDDCDKCEIIGNTIIATGGSSGIFLDGGNQHMIADNYIVFDGDYGFDIINVYDTILANNVIDGGDAGNVCILVDTTSGRVTLEGNTILQADLYGIEMSDADRCIVANNIIRSCGQHGLYINGSDHSIFTGNSVYENSQDTDDTYDDIHVSAGTYNLISNNICRAGAEANQPRYGINIGGGTGNKVINNDLYDDGFGTAPYNDAGTGTIYVEPGIDDTPVNGELGQPISSNWAFDHKADVSAHHVKYTDAEAKTQAEGAKLDDHAAPDDNTDLNVSTTTHGLAPKAVAPASGLLNVYGIANGETAITNKAAFDNTNPAALGTASPGTQVIAARRDHVHTDPVPTHAALTATHGVSGAIVGTSDSQVLTTKTLIATSNVVEEISTIASSATPTPTGGSLRNFFTVTALAEGATFAAPSGTPANSNKLIIRILDNGTARSLAWNAIYRAIGCTLPTTTVISKTMYLAIMYNSAGAGTWDVLAVNTEA